MLSFTYHIIIYTSIMTNPHKLQLLTRKNYQKYTHIHHIHNYITFSYFIFTLSEIVFIFQIFTKLRINYCVSTCKTKSKDSSSPKLARIIAVIYENMSSDAISSVACPVSVRTFVGNITDIIASSTKQRRVKTKPILSVLLTAK